MGTTEAQDIQKKKEEVADLTEEVKDLQDELKEREENFKKMFGQGETADISAVGAFLSDALGIRETEEIKEDLKEAEADLKASRLELDGLLKSRSAGAVREGAITAAQSASDLAAGPLASLAGWLRSSAENDTGEQDTAERDTAQ